MEVKVGVSAARELIIDVESTSDEVKVLVEGVIAEGSPMLWLTDRRHRQYGIPVDKIAYVEFGDDKGRQVGFARS